MTDKKQVPEKWRLRAMVDNTYHVYGEGEYDIIFPRIGLKPDANALLIVSAPSLKSNLAAKTEECAELKSGLDKRIKSLHSAVRQRVYDEYIDNSEYDTEGFKPWTVDVAMDKYNEFLRKALEAKP